MIPRTLAALALMVPWLILAPATAAEATVTGPGSVTVGSTIKVSGTGWTVADGSAGSVVAVKLDEGGISTTGDVANPASGQVIANKTVWAAVQADKSGAWSAELAFPTTANGSDTWAAGTSHSIRFLSGSLVSGDVVRTMSVDVNVVAAGGSGATPTPTPSTTAPAASGATCQTSVATATAKATVTTSGLGGVVRPTGAGWCHPGAGKGGSTIGIKIDDGAYSHLDSSVNANRTVWAVVKANDTTGEIDAQIALPDGTTTGATGSTPAFPEGSHTLRLLSGSLVAGDTIRTVQTNAFTVGAYQPTTVPDPVDYSTGLTAGVRGGATVARAGSTFAIKLPKVAVGSWVYLSSYLPDGSPDLSWGDTWFRAGSGGGVVADVPKNLPTGKLKIVAQSGDESSFGSVVGWASYAHAATAKNTTAAKGNATTAPSGGTTTSTAPAGGTTVSTVPTVATAAMKPTFTPPAPAGGTAALTSKNLGTVQATRNGTSLDVKVASANPGDWVFPYIYPANGEPIGVGWLALDNTSSVHLDIAALGSGRHTVAVLDSTSKLRGWAAVQVFGSDEVRNEAATVVASAVKLPLVGRADGWLIAAGVAILLGSVGGALSVQNSRPEKGILQ